MLVLGLMSGILAACEETANHVAASTAAEAPSLACGEDGYLATTLYGAISATLDWSAADLNCEGMPRPDNEGARLRLAGVDGDRRIAFIIAIPGLARGTVGSELPSNVTLIEEGQGRFFSTPDLNNCWTDVTRFEALGASTSAFAVGGTLYCVRPIAEVNGSSSVSLAELRFQGLLDWSDG